MNLHNQKWNETPKNPLKISNHLMLPNEMQDLKLSSEMRLKRERPKWDPSHLYSIRALNEKLCQPHHKPKL